MNAPHTPGPGKAPAATPSGPPPRTARPDGNRDSRRVFRMAIVIALAALVAVVAFNLMAPKNRLQPPGGTGGDTPFTQGAQQSGGPPAGGTDAAGGAAPQRADTPTPAGRESVGAPAGSTPATAAPQ
ncbi:hypothetical protein [Acidovorax sp. FG27]|uniref:hypothetical protein n=1 Tax=Acidovorax sp. FG27 TaxID=3133652 RepID=UPI0030E839EA